MKYLFTFSFIFFALTIFSQETINDSIVSKRSIERCALRDSSWTIDFSDFSKIAVSSLDKFCIDKLNKRGKVLSTRCVEGSVIKSGEIDDYRFNEIHFLSDSLKMDLDSILNSKKKNDFTHMACYEPRNAILFYDEKGNIRECIELCFECEGNLTTFSGIKEFDLCSDQYQDLKGFFRKLGVKRGVVGPNN